MVLAGGHRFVCDWERRVPHVRAFLGLVQIGLGIGGVIALINGQWMWMVLAWGAAGLTGFFGNLMVRATEGISEGGQAAINDIPRALELLRQGQYSSAKGVTRAAVASFRMGGDKTLLPIALTVHAVALASLREVSDSRKALDEASELFRRLPPALAADLDDMQHLLTLVRQELDLGVPDPDGLVADVITFNDAP